MHKQNNLLLVLLLALGSVGCDSSDDADMEPSDTGSGGSGPDEGSGGSEPAGEPEIKCFGRSMCEADSICCSELATMSTGCVVGDTCPGGGLQLCESSEECTSGDDCGPLTVMGIEFGLCGLLPSGAPTGDSDAGI